MLITTAPLRAVGKTCEDAVGELGAFTIVELLPIDSADLVSAHSAATAPLPPQNALRQRAEISKLQMEPELNRMGYTEISVRNAGGQGFFMRAKKNGKWVALKASHRGGEAGDYSIRAEAGVGKVLSDAEAGRAERYFPDLTGLPEIELVTLPNGQKVPLLVSEYISDRTGGPTVSDREAPSLDTFTAQYWSDHPDHWPKIRKQISEAVSRMHGLADPIYHLDLKPANILITHDASGEPHVKIIDFGISRSRSGNLGKPSLPGTISGTPSYLSPAGFRGAAPTPAQDTHALRVIDWEHHLATIGNPAGNSINKSPLSVVRYFESNSVNFDPELVVPIPSGPFKTPTVAFDLNNPRTGKPLTLPERLLGYAEFSQRPQTPSSRQRLIESAAGNPAKFFSEARRDLMAMDETSLARDPAVRTRAAQEFLESTVLTDMWGRPGGLEWKSPDGKFQRTQWEAIVRGAYALEIQSRAHSHDATTLGPLNVHSQLNFERFFARAKELAELGLIKDVKTLEHEAMMFTVVNPVLGLVP